MGDKRPHSPDIVDASAGALVKRQRKDDGQIVIGTITKEGVKRTSNLLEPIMQLTGHGGEVYGLEFSPDGQSLASCSFDKTLLLWRTFGECENYMLLRGHKNAVLEVHWMSGGELLLSASADHSLRCWDAQAGVQVKRLTEHKAVVNTCCPVRRGPQLFASGGDDGSVKVWDTRSKRSVQSLAGDAPVTAVAWSDAGDQVYSGGTDNVISVWELRKAALGARLAGHGDTVTGLALSPDGSHLLSNAMDNTLRLWDMRPYAPANRCVKVLTGHQHSFEKTLLRCAWEPCGQRVTAGSADRIVYIWDVATRQLAYALPGHKGSVNSAVFHPNEPIIGSASSDRTIFLGELAEE